MANLTMEDAMALAGSLVTIGHPFSAVAIQATALDLIKWCKGAIVNGRLVSPQNQAAALIDEARTTWEEGWPEKGGTKKLSDLFKQKFQPAVRPGNGFIDYGNEPCIVCNSGKKFRDCCQVKPAGDLSPSGWNIGGVH